MKSGEFRIMCGFVCYRYIVLQSGRVAAVELKLQRRYDMFVQKA